MPARPLTRAEARAICAMRIRGIMLSSPNERIWEFRTRTPVSRFRSAAQAKLGLCVYNYWISSGRLGPRRSGRVAPAQKVAEMDVELAERLQIAGVAQRAGVNGLEPASRHDIGDCL